MQQNNNNNQQGSAHAVIIILLILALLGALGFVFYQNFIAKTPAPVQTQQPVVEEDKNVTEQVAFNSDIYEIDHPKTWSAITQKQPNALNTTVTLTSPDTNIETTFSVAEGGVGGACDTSSPLKVRFYNVHSTAVTKLGKDKAQVVETMTDAEGGGYKYAIGLTEEGGGTHAAVGDSHCTVAYVGLAASVIVNTKTSAIEQPTIFAKVKFPKVTDESGKVKEMQPVKDMLQTDTYKEAVAILESARKK